MIEDVLRRWPKLKGCLRLEITEKALMARGDDHSLILKSLQEMGASCQIDDFGTGFSSLSNLAQLTVDALKIDRSFFTNMSEHTKNKKIICAIVTLAQSLGISVTAEGIETEEQCTLVQDLGCDEAQGYLFSKPMIAEVVEKEYLLG